MILLCYEQYVVPFVMLFERGKVKEPIPTIRRSHPRPVQSSAVLKLTCFPQNQGKNQTLLKNPFQASHVAQFYLPFVDALALSLTSTALASRGALWNQRCHQGAPAAKAVCRITE